LCIRRFALRVAGFVPVHHSSPASPKVLRDADFSHRSATVRAVGVRQIGICNRSGSEIAPAIARRSLRLRNLREIPSWTAAGLTAPAVEQSEIKTPDFLENRTTAKLARRHAAGNTGVPVGAIVDSKWPRSCTGLCQDRTKLRAPAQNKHDREDAALPNQCTVFGCRSATQAGRTPTRRARTSSN